MNIDAAIETHRVALLRLLTTMFSLAGIEPGGSVDSIQQGLRLMILRVLGPAESAVRRLVFLKARDLPDEEYQRKDAPKNKAARRKGAARSTALSLFDPRKKPKKHGRKHPAGPGPRIFFFDERDAPFCNHPDTKPVLPEDMVKADTLCQRLNALFRVLNDLDKQAKRLKRAQARRKLIPGLKLQGVLRIHTPPGHREKGRSENERAVDEILYECQIAARRWIAKNDSS
jgi:hypothetical protein